VPLNGGQLGGHIHFEHVKSTYGISTEVESISLNAQGFKLDPASGNDNDGI
jgi:hypothetical protein